LAIALAGGWWWWRQDRHFLLSSLAWMLPLSVYAFFYDTGDSHVYLIVAALLLALWWGGGTCYLLRLLAGRTRNAAWQRVGLIAILLLPFASLALHWQEVDLSDDWLAHAYAYQALDGVEPDSLVVVRGDRPTFALWYAIYAEERRPDVAVVSGPMLAFIWYRDHVRRLYPHLVIDEPTAAEEVTTNDLVRELIAHNMPQMTVYATDPSDPWKAWFDFTKEGAPIYRAHLKSGGEQEE
jgi:hypothetical protein